MREKLEEYALWVKEHKVRALSVGVVVLLIFIFLTTYYLKPQRTQQPSSQDKPSGTTTKQQVVLPAPKIYFTTYENPPVFPTVPETVNVYTLKDNLTLDDVRSIGSRLSLSEYKVFPDTVFLSNTSSPLAIMTVETRTGGFSYQSFPVDTESNVSADPVRVASNFLDLVNVNDGTITCDITYERNDVPDVTFVECHRDWQKAGLPILGFLGTVNVAETTALKDLAVGGAEMAEPDPGIVRISSGQPGVSRPIDYNSATIAVDKYGRVIAAASNIRPIVKTETVVSKASLLTPEEALAALKQNASFSLTVPAGSGLVDPGKVYPNNIASAKVARITDYVLVYLEKPGALPQKYLAPMYLIRGSSQLASGYRVSFVQIVPALKNGLSPLSTSLPGQVAGEMVSESDSGLKLGTFQPTIDTSLQPSPTVSLPLPTAIPSINDACNPRVSDLNPVFQTGDLTYGIGRPRIGKETQAGQIPGGAIFLYYVPVWSLALDPNNSPHLPSESAQKAAEMNRMMSEISSVQQLIHQRLAELNFSSPLLDLRERNSYAVAREFYWNPVCPLRASGPSPTIFIYGPTGMHYTLRINHPLTYSDPLRTDFGKWQVNIIDTFNRRINGYDRPFIYYEYQPISFTKPDKGWIVKKSDIADFVTHTLSPQLALLPQEADRLVFELHHAAFSINANYLFIGPIDQKEVDEKLPLTISPKPEIVTRLHFYVQGQDHFTQVGAPTLSPVERKAFMILELGATSSVQ